MIQPEALKKAEPLLWSTGSGVDDWEMFCACLAGDLSAVVTLVPEDPSLVRSHHAYRTPLYFAVRENRILAASPALADDPDALVNAAGEGHEPFVRLLLRYRPDLPKQIAFPGWSVGAKTRELDELLFAHGMIPSQPDWVVERLARHSR